MDLKSDFALPLKNNKVKNGNDVEKYALELRTVWELGLHPIVNVIEILEDKRIKVFEIEAPDSFDDLSAFRISVAIGDGCSFGWWWAKER